MPKGRVWFRGQVVGRAPRHNPAPIHAGFGNCASHRPGLADIAKANLGWGYTKIRDALRTGLKVEIGRTTRGRGQGRLSIAPLRTAELLPSRGRMSLGDAFRDRTGVNTAEDKVVRRAAGYGTAAGSSRPAKYFDGCACRPGSPCASGSSSLALMRDLLGIVLSYTVSDEASGGQGHWSHPCPYTPRLASCPPTGSWRRGPKKASIPLNTDLAKKLLACLAELAAPTEPGQPRPAGT